MEKTNTGFNRRMKSDREFRQKILTAWKRGSLMEVLLGEGYTFSLEELDRGLPQVRTGIRAGGCSSCSPCGCGSE